MATSCRAASSHRGTRASLEGRVLEKTSATLDFRRVAKPTKLPSAATEKSQLFVGPGVPRVAMTSIMERDASGTWTDSMIIPVELLEDGTFDHYEVLNEADLVEIEAVPGGHWLAPARTLPPNDVRISAEWASALPALALVRSNGSRSRATASATRIAVGTLAVAAAFAFVATGQADGLTHELNALAADVMTDVGTTETTSAVVAAPQFASLPPISPPVVAPSAKPLSPPPAVSMPGVLTFAPLTVGKAPVPSASHRPASLAGIHIPVDPDLVAPVTVPGVPAAVPGIPRPAAPPRTEMARL